jgi:DsbC/DsbD-like thiol-disulfide interchange protein
MMKAISFLLMSAGLFLLAGGLREGAATAAQKGKTSESVVKVTAKADKPDANGKQAVTITMEVEKDWHTYANPVGLEDLEDAKTVVTITGKNKLEDVKIDYPKGKLQKDVVGDYSIYVDKVTIKAKVQRAKGDTGPLQVTVKFQACNDRSCLVPATVKKTVE